MPELNKFDRKLEERSYLAVEFPQTDKRVFRTYIPFLENPTITEKGSSNLSEYNLLARPGSMFSYAGSPSRVINLTFKISLLNLLHLDATEGISEKFKRSFNLFFSDREMSKKRFNLKATPISNEEPSNLVSTGSNQSFAGPAFASQPGGGVLDTTEGLQGRDVGSADVSMGVGMEHASIHRAHYRDLVGQVTGSQPVFDGIANLLTEGINALPNLFGGADGQSISSPQESEKRISDLLDLVFVWVNLVRSTTLNNSTNTVQGPPTVRLTHGPMYNNIPCVVSNYSIRIVDEAGFEMQSLTPRQLEISLVLKENRVGDQGNFETGAVGSGDNVVGWEAIIDNNNLDPYNGLINPEKEYLR